MAKHSQVHSARSHRSRRDTAPARRDELRHEDTAGAALSVAGDDADAWQLELFDHSGRERRTLERTIELLGPLSEERCLLIGGSTLPGALNVHLRSAGGCWSWAELEPARARAVGSLLDEPVATVSDQVLPFPSGEFQRVVAVHVHDAIADSARLNAEIARVLAPHGVAIILVYVGERRAALHGLEGAAAGPEDSEPGAGALVHALHAAFTNAGLEVIWQETYSPFFTDLGERVSDRLRSLLLGGRGGVEHAALARGASLKNGELKRIRRVYRATYPIERAFSILDTLARRRAGRALAIAAEKPGSSTAVQAP